MVPGRAGRLCGIFGGLLVAEGEDGLSVYLSHGLAGRPPPGYRQFLSRESFTNKLPSFLGTCPISCDSCSTVFGVISEVIGQDLPSWHTSPEAEQRSARLSPGTATLVAARRGQAQHARETTKGFSKMLLPKNPLLPKMQLPKMLLHLFCTSLFTVARSGTASRVLQDVALSPPASMALSSHLFQW